VAESLTPQQAEAVTVFLERMRDAVDTVDAEHPDLVSAGQS